MQFGATQGGNGGGGGSASIGNELGINDMNESLNVLNGSGLDGVELGGDPPAPSWASTVWRPTMRIPPHRPACQWQCSVAGCCSLAGSASMLDLRLAVA